MSERHSILVVDDEPENLDLLSRTLGFDYDVHVASSGESAIEQLEKIENLALIISDQRMPGMFGTELLQRVRAMRSDTVRIILTGYTDARDLIAAINSSNVYRYLTKPWDIDHLQAVVRRAIRLYEAGGAELVDDITGLPRASLFTRELDREIYRARASSDPLSLFRIEMNEYGAIRDAVGLATCEQITRELADALRGLVLPLDLVATRGDGVFLLARARAESGVEARIAQALEATGALAVANVPEVRIGVRRVDVTARHGGARDVLRELGLEPAQEARS